VEKQLKTMKILLVLVFLNLLVGENSVKASRQENGEAEAYEEEVANDGTAHRSRRNTQKSR